MLIQSGFPEWMVRLIESRGIAGALAALDALIADADTSEAGITYTSYHSRLTGWNTTVPLQPTSVAEGDLTTPVPLNPETP